jgi:hypothetical protein
MTGFFEELQRRKVYRVAAAYIITAGFVLSRHASHLLHNANPLRSCNRLSGDHVRGLPGLRTEPAIEILASKGIGESHHRRALVWEPRRVAERNALYPARGQAVPAIVV